MSFRINTNTQAAFSLTALNKTTDSIANRQMRLATGSRINTAGDDSAGFTISNKLQATSRGQAQALSNIGDAKSMLSVAEGSLGSTMDILQTMKEKAVQAGNSSMGTEERAAIQSQVDALVAEVGDILGGANFNGTQLFSDDASTSLNFQVGDASGDTFGASVQQMGVETLGLATIATEDADAIDPVDGVDEVLSTATLDVSANPPHYGEYGALSGQPDPIIDATGWREDEALDLYFEVDWTNSQLRWALAPEDLNGVGYATIDFASFTGNVATLDSGTGSTLTLDFGGPMWADDDGAGFEVSLSAYTEGVDAVEGSPAVSAGDFVSDIDLTTDAGVASALTTIDAAISSVNQTASSLGDVQNRLDFKAQNLETSMNNYDAARSRISDADFAKEQMEVVKLQILQQTGSAMFAQANASGQSVLSFF